MIRVSVIIPIFNSGAYLQECLDSVVDQTLRDIEIICVNDGSTDNSLNILETYAKKDPRIKILNQANAGSAMARNNGIREASGEYLSILDSDDFFNLEMLEKMYAKAKHYSSDIVICLEARYSVDGIERVEASKLDILDNPDCFSAISVSDRLFQLSDPNAWTKLFRRQFIVDNSLQFQDIKTCNDVYFTYAAMALAERISCVNEALVYYRQGVSNSISADRGIYFNNIFIAGDAIREKLQNAGIFEAMSTSFYKRMVASFNYEFQQIENMFHDKAADFLPKKFHKDIPKTKFTLRKIHLFFKSYLLFPWNIYKIYKMLFSNKTPTFNLIKFINSYLFFPWYTYKIYRKLSQ